MNQRGRKGEAQLQAVSELSGKPVETEERLPAPMQLTDAEQAVWNTIVNDLPAKFFSKVHIPLLSMYCRHIVQAEIIADEILNFDRSWLNEPGGLGRYDKLLSMQERETRAASSMATRLRLTLQSVDAKTAGRKIKNDPVAKKPWEK